MNTVVPLSNLPSQWTAKQLELIKKTVARDCDRDSKGVDLHLGEFDWAMEICRALKLDPLRRQIFFFCFAKDDPKRRQMVPVVSIAGYRAIAARSGNYRPNENTPEFEYDASKVDPLVNPKGLVKATETVWQHLHGQWFPVRAEARWDAYAPIVEEPEDGYSYEDTGDFWPDGKPKRKRLARGKIVRKLDPNKERWRIDPEGMLAKCSEALCLRKAWPDDFAGTYSDGELDRAEVLDLTPTEIVERAEADAKLELMGGKNALTVDWCDGSKLVRVPEAAFCDAVLKWSALPERSPEDLASWWTRNEAARAEYKARHGGEYLEFQKAYERRRLDLGQKDGAQESAHKAHAPSPQAIAAPQEQAASEPAKQSATGKDDKAILAHLQKRIKDCASLAELSELESRFKGSAFQTLSAAGQKQALEMLAKAKE